MSRPLRLAAAAVLIISLSLGALMGWSMVRGGRPEDGSAPRVAQADPAGIYHLDSLTDAPAGSVAYAYLRLASASVQGRE